jgi:hypothetical protein
MKGMVDGSGLLPRTMELYRQYRKEVICPKTGNFEVSERNGGRIGI